MNEQMNVQIEQYAYIKEKNCVFIYLTFHCYDSKKKSPLALSVCHPLSSMMVLMLLP